MMIGGITVYGILKIRNRAVNLHSHQQYSLTEPNSNRFATFSKGTAFLLLAVGVIGVLSVRRKKKNNRSPAQKKESQRIEDRNKAFIRLNKQYLDLQYKITLHKSTGDTPPDGLLKEISDLERKVRLISRALE